MVEHGIIVLDWFTVIRKGNSFGRHSCIVFSDLRFEINPSVSEIEVVSLVCFPFCVFDPHKTRALKFFIEIEPFSGIYIVHVLGQQWIKEPGESWLLLSLLHLEF